MAPASTSQVDIAQQPARASGHLRPASLLLFAIVIFGVALRLYFFSPDLIRSPDEGTYTHQANTLLAQGNAGFRTLAQELASDPVRMSETPSPTRVGYLAILISWMQITRDKSPLAGAQLSLLCSLTALALVAFTSYRAFSPIVAIIATLFFSVLPFELTTSRRAWQESFIALLAWALISIAIYIARSTSHRRAAGFAAFALLGLIAITTKENMALFFFLCAAGLATHFILQHDRSAVINTVACTLAAGVVSLAILASLFGGLSQYTQFERAYLHNENLSAYSLQIDSATPSMFFTGLLLTIPVVLLAALIGLATSVFRTFRARTPFRGNAALGIALISLSTILLQIFTQRYNFRYTAPAYCSLCLLAGIGIEAILVPLARFLAPLGRPLAWGILSFSLAVGALRDLNFARDKFLLPAMQDLAVRPILRIPPAELPSNLPH